MLFNDYKKSGIIHKIVQNNIKKKLSNVNNALDIVKKIENDIKLYTKYNTNNPTKNGIAFPVGIGINEVAAHFTPSKDNNPKINKDDIVKIDFGVHINGCITDGAFSWCPSGKYNKLIDISKQATNIGIKNSGVNVILGEIGGYIQEYIESCEIEIDQKVYPVKSIYDLCGHKIDQYKIHSGKAVPNVRIPYYERMLEDEVYAIETFPTIGNSSIITDHSICNHFMITDYNNNFDEKTKDIYFNRKTLAFCPRWFDFDIPDNKYIKKYPLLRGNGMIAQTEKTIYIKNNIIEILN